MLTYAARIHVYTINSYSTYLYHIKAPRFRVMETLSLLVTQKKVIKEGGYYRLPRHEELAVASESDPTQNWMVRARQALEQRRENELKKNADSSA